MKAPITFQCRGDACELTQVERLEDGSFRTVRVRFTLHGSVMAQKADVIEALVKSAEITVTDS